MIHIVLFIIIIIISHVQQGKKTFLSLSFLFFRWDPPPPTMLWHERGRPSTLLF